MTDLATPLEAPDPALDNLSTAPAPPTPGRRRGTRGLLGGWRQLTSMRTALLLLALLALAAVPGSLLPQRGLNPVKVDDFLARHGTLGPLLDKLSLFDVFAAPWFAAVYLLLFVSLIGCLVPRIRLHLRALRRDPPPAPRHLLRLRTSAQWDDDRSPADLVDAARRQLTAARWRVRVRDEGDGAVSLAAEKGYLRETGNLVFHVALVVLLVGIALGGLFGYKGTVLVVEGQGFSNVRSSYDVFEPSRLERDSELTPFAFTLRKFSASYQPSGEPLTFDAAVDYTPRPGAAARPYDVRVNHPLSVGGAAVYLVGHGYALHLVVRDKSGTVVYDQDTPFLPDDSMFASHGVVKVPAGLPHQLGLTGFFYPTYGATPFGPDSTYPGLRDPVLELAAWQGDLGLSSGAPQSVYELPVAQLKNVGTHEMAPGQTWRLADGTTVTLAGIHQWATFQVAHDPGTRVVLVAAILVIAGLLASLRVRRRRLWVRATPAGDDTLVRRTVVHAAGLARSDADGLGRELGAFAERLQDKLQEKRTKG